MKRVMSFHRPPRWSASVLLVLLGGGGVGGGGRRVAEPLTEPPRLLRLTSADVEGGPDERSVLLTVGPRGRVIYDPESPDYGLLAMLGPGDHVPTAIGRPGRGPGELLMPIAVGLTDTSAFVWDLASALVTEWDTAGRQVREFPRLGPMRPAALVPGRGVVGVRDRAEGSDIYLVDPVSGAERLVVAATDPAMRYLFPPDPPKSPTGRPLSPRRVVSAWPGGILVGNGWTYRIALFDWDGRLLASIGRDLGERRSTPHEVERSMLAARVAGIIRSASDSVRMRNILKDERKEWFVPVLPPQVDAHGRVWVVVRQDGGAAADIFEGGRFLGRITIPCEGYEGRWGLHGEILAAVCASTNAASDRGVELRWFRIVEKDSTRR